MSSRPSDFYEFLAVIAAEKRWPTALPGRLDNHPAIFAGVFWLGLNCLGLRARLVGPGTVLTGSGAEVGRPAPHARGRDGFAAGVAAALGDPEGLIDLCRSLWGSNGRLWEGCCQKVAVERRTSSFPVGFS